ncbi:MAG: hypothetical protein GF398_14860 [Chitinivibrionales bacterium]|nr:hypothetical protein [Chitinivibrionales bacterium]
MKLNRTVKRIAVIFAILLILGGVASYIIGPRLVSNVVDRILTRNGFTNARFAISHVSFANIVIRNFEFENDQMHGLVKRCALQFEFLKFVGGKMKSLRIDNTTLQLKQSRISGQQRAGYREVLNPLISYLKQPSIQSIHAYHTTIVPGNERGKSGFAIRHIECLLADNAVQLNFDSNEPLMRGSVKLTANHVLAGTWSLTIEKLTKHFQGFNTQQFRLAPCSSISARGTIEYDQVSGLIAARLQTDTCGLTVAVDRRKTRLRLDRAVSQLSLSPDLNAITVSHLQVFDATCTLHVNYNLRTGRGGWETYFDELEADQFSRLFGQTKKISGTIDIKSSGSINAGRTRFFTEIRADTLGVVLADSLRMAPLGIGALRFNLDYLARSRVGIKLRSRLDGASFDARAQANLDKKRLKWTCKAERIGAAKLQASLNNLFQDVTFDNAGAFLVTARGSAKQGAHVVRLEAFSDEAMIDFVHESNLFSFVPYTVVAELEFDSTFDATGGSLALNNFDLVHHNADLWIKNAHVTIPLHGGAGGVRGAFDFESLLVGEQVLPGIAGDYSLGDDSLAASGKGRFSSEFNYTATARFAVRDELTGVIDVLAPPSRLTKSAQLEPWIGFVADFAYEGRCEGRARLRFRRDTLVSEATFRFADGVLRHRSTGLVVNGIAGTLSIDNFDPLMSDAVQRFSFSRASIGDFSAADGICQFTVNAGMPFSPRQITAVWSGGTVEAHDIQPTSDFAQTDLDLRMKNIDLKQVLAFFDYEGIEGSGTIHGEIPVTIRPAAKWLLSFGDGYLRADPPKGSLQLSEKYARQILGIKKDIDRTGATAQETAQLMMLDALRDMEYSRLEADFTRVSSQEWQSQVRAEGYGPRGATENRVPIGGLTVNINGLDYLINSLVSPAGQKQGR